jgi:predicted NBD/HSP70 family sugar kinase
MADEEWVFALSLDERVEWRLARVVGASSETRLVADKNPSNRGEITLPEIDKYKHRFERLIREHLESIRDAHRDKNVRAVGVSIIGLADRSKGHLVSIARKDWGKPDKRPVIDFARLFDGIFPKITESLNGKYPLINIHNESTAKCLAEYEVWRRQLSTKAKSIRKQHSLFYVMFSEGVNGGFVSEGRPLTTELHTELGHMWPRPYGSDVAFDAKLHGGCRVHKFCFEGMCSGVRIRSTFTNGQPISETSLSNEARKLIAFYVAQMCMHGVLAVSPERIMLGGDLILPSLLPLVRGFFDYFNDGGSREPYLTYAAMKRPGFISMASIPPKEAGAAAALELARLVVAHHGLALSQAWGSRPHSLGARK